MGSIELDLGRLSLPNWFDIASDSVDVFLVGYQIQLHSSKMVVMREYENTSASAVVVLRDSCFKFDWVRFPHTNFLV